MTPSPGPRSARRIDRSDLDASVLWTMTRAAHAASHFVRAALADVVLSPVQFGLLAQLSVEDGLSTAELARRCLVRPQTMRGVVEVLVGRGLIRSEGAGGKGRLRRIWLTGEGASVFTRAWPAFAAANEPGALGLRRAEAVTLNDQLLRFAGLRTPARAPEKG